MRITKILRFFCWSVVFSSVTVPSVVGAVSAMDSVTGSLAVTANSAGFGATPMSITALVGAAINIVLTLVGIVLLIYLVYAGILYLTSQGDEKTVKKAKDIFKTTITGLIIIVAAYAIANYIMAALVSVT